MRTMQQFKEKKSYAVATDVAPAALIDGLF